MGLGSMVQGSRFSSRFIYLLCVFTGGNGRPLLSSLSSRSRLSSPLGRGGGKPIPRPAGIGGGGGASLRICLSSLENSGSLQALFFSCVGGLVAAVCPLCVCVSVCVCVFVSCAAGLDYWCARTGVFRAPCVRVCMCVNVCVCVRARVFSV